MTTNSSPAANIGPICLVNDCGFWIEASFLPWYLMLPDGCLFRLPPERRHLPRRLKLNSKIHLEHRPSMFLLNDDSICWSRNDLWKKTSRSKNWWK